MKRAIPAYCFKQGRRRTGRPKCILLSGHGGKCQTEIAPKEDRDA